MLRHYKENWWILFYRLHNKRALWKIISRYSVKKGRPQKIFLLLVAAEHLNTREMEQKPSLCWYITVCGVHCLIWISPIKPYVWWGMEFFKELWDPCRKTTISGSYVDTASILLISYWSGGYKALHSRNSPDYAQLHTERKTHTHPLLFFLISWLLGRENWFRNLKLLYRPGCKTKSFKYN